MGTEVFLTRLFFPHSTGASLRTSSESSTSGTMPGARIHSSAVLGIPPSALWEDSCTLGRAGTPARSSQMPLSPRGWRVQSHTWEWVPDQTPVQIAGLSILLTNWVFLKPPCFNPSANGGSCPRADRHPPTNIANSAKLTWVPLPAALCFCPVEWRILT